MNFYPHHIGDFNNSTRHLTRVERSVYRDAIELYYDTESALTDDIDKLCRKLLCVSDEEKTALNAVLDEFFLMTDAGYTHERCDIEIAKYRSNTNAKARAGIASAAKRKQNSTGVQQNSTPVHNQEPLTINQEPIEKPLRRKSAPMPADFQINGVSKAYAQDRNLDIPEELISFSNWHTAKGSTFKDWQAAWRTWCDKAVEFGRAKGRSPPGKQANRDSYDMQAQAAAERIFGHDRPTEIDITPVAGRMG